MDKLKLIMRKKNSIKVGGVWQHVSRTEGATTAQMGWRIRCPWQAKLRLQDVRPIPEVEYVEKELGRKIVNCLQFSSWRKIAFPIRLVQ